MIELIATDLDGTLMGADSNIVPDENIAALAEASDRGVKIVLASGRPYPFMLVPMRQLEKCDYSIFGNGTGIFDEAKQKPIPLEGTEMDIDQGTFVSEILRKYDVHIQVQSEGKLYLNPRDNQYFTDRFNKRIPDANRDSIVVVDDVLGIPEIQTSQKYNLEFVQKREREEAWELISKGDGLFLSSSWADNMEVNSARATKGQALASLCEILGVDRGSVMALGDNLNDVDMIEFAGLGVAVGNGTPETLEAADWVAPKNTENGVAVAVRKFLREDFDD